MASVTGCMTEHTIVKGSYTPVTVLCHLGKTCANTREEALLLPMMVMFVAQYTQTLRNWHRSGTKGYHVIVPCMRADLDECRGQWVGLLRRLGLPSWPGRFEM